MTPDEFFLATFFGQGNEIRLDFSTAASGTNTEKVRPWVERYLQGQRPSPLPRVRTVRGSYQTTWYVIVDDRDSAALTRAEIQGFLGPSYTDWDPLADRLDPADGIDSLVADRHPHVLKVTITGLRGGRAYRNRTEVVRDRLEMWLQVRARQPAHVREEAELLADLVYRFEDALRLGRLDLAEDHLRIMRQAGGLSTTNLSGLEFLLLEAREAWDDIWNKDSYDRLVEAGPPRRVMQAMLRAAYNAKILDHQRTGDGSGALQAFVDEIAPRCSPLLGTAKGLTAGEAFSLRVLRELTRSDPTWARIAATQADAIRSGVDDEWLAKVITAAQIAGPDTGGSDLDVFERVGREFGRNNLDVAWDLAWAADGSLPRSIWLLRLADEGGSVSWAHGAIESVSDLTPPPSDAALRRHEERVRKRFMIEPGGAGKESVPSGWLEWAEYLGKDERFTAGVSLAADGRTEWSLDDAAMSDWRSFASALNGVTEVNEPTLRRSIPHIMTALGDSPRDEEGLQEVYDRLLSVVLLDPAPGDTFFLTLGDLVERRLALGMDAESYSSLLGDITELGNRWVAPVTISDLLDLVDVLFLHVCPDHEARLGFVTNVLSAAVAILDRISPPVLALLSEFADAARWGADPFGVRLAEVSSSDSFEDVKVSNVLAGTTLALYSLDESALSRAKAAIQRLCASAKVHIYSGKVATQPLVAAARSADFFVVAHRSATHAATDAIRAARFGPLAFAQGKGSSSLIRAVWDWAVTKKG